MTDKELKRLSRKELLELLLVQTREVERLRKEMDDLHSQLDDRSLRMEEAGNLAQAVLSVNGVMEAAQAAAQQYLDNIIAMEQETRLKCDQILRSASEEARNIRMGVEVDEEEYYIRRMHEISESPEF